MKVMTTAIVALFAVAAMANEPAHTTTPTTTTAAAPAAPAKADAKATEHKEAKADTKAHKCDPKKDKNCKEEAAPAAKH